MSTTDYSSTTQGSQPVRTDIDENFYIGESKFEFPNGDVYEGGYAAHRNGLVWREGKGTYTTKDGQTYTGKWYNDKLVEKSEVEIVFPDGTQYRGPLVKSQYSGPALYSIDEHLNLLCNFVNNRPVGEVLLLDINGRFWRGPAELDDCLLLPDHIYFSELPEDLGKGPLSRKLQSIVNKEASKRISMLTSSVSSNTMMKVMKGVSKGTEIEKEVEQPQRMHQLEMKIFAKTKKTISDLRFDESEWYQNYIRFKEHYENICKKIKEEGLKTLNKEEMEWHTNFLQFRKKYFEIMHKKKNKEKDLEGYNLFTLYNSQQYKKHPEIKVFYPTRIEEEIFAEEEENIDELYDEIKELNEDEKKVKSKSRRSFK